jgi:acyl carrier protein
MIPETITAILSEILDLDPADITAGTYVIRDLKAESIDLLEIGVAIQHRLGLAVDDDILFLKNARIVLTRAEKQGRPVLDALRAEYPHLPSGRLEEILADLPGGPVLQVRDLVAYAESGQTGARK